MEVVASIIMVIELADFRVLIEIAGLGYSDVVIRIMACLF